MTVSGQVHSLEVSGVGKTFDTTKVVDGISFNVNPGEIFGLIGPNGAGKTTTIRMIMDIIRPDSGQIKVFGRIINEQVKDSIGYLPEERGLYKKMSVLQSLYYIASLKGVDRNHADKKAEELLKRVGMTAHRHKKMEELSRGMSQLAQFMVTVIHEPDLIILDEPFANLDPVNTELLKEIFFELRNGGKAVILSTHRMNEVEELCDRVFMINRGKGVLYGGLNEIKSRYRKNSIFLEYEGELGELRDVTIKQERQGTAELILSESKSPMEVLEQLLSQGIQVNRFEVSTPPLHDIFLQIAGEEN